jgi:hypothetical protein
LHIFQLANFAALVEHRASHQVAYVRPTFFQRRALAAGNLEFAADQQFRVGDGINPTELKNQQSFVGPNLFDFHFAAGVFAAGQREQLHSDREAIGNVAQDFCADFAMAALSFYDTGQRDEVVG